MAKKKGSSQLTITFEELPSIYADKLGVEYTKSVIAGHKREHGQFFTPLEVGRFMAQFVNFTNSYIKILDPGCGIGVLSCVLAEHIVSKFQRVKEIHLVAFETDVELLPLAEKALDYLGLWLKNQDVEFTYFLCKNDFILHNSHILKDQQTNETYDIIITNPPYFKLPKGDARKEIAKSVIHGQANIYTIFLVIAARLLDRKGQLVFITPRSFCSGQYFKLFRAIFFVSVKFSAIHLFESRKKQFRRDKVLQENIIVAAEKRVIKKMGKNEQIEISSSKDIYDINDRRRKKYYLSDLIDLASDQKILHLPSSGVDDRVIETFRKWTGSLHAYGFKISTGPVVDFRSTQFIGFKKKSKYVPLIWLHNVESMQVTWPLTEYKGKPKGQYILETQKSLSRLVPNRNYVLLRRFSSKDDNRRLVAAPYIGKKHASAYIGIENHLNYIYGLERDLTNYEVIGLSALLNSRLFDLFFRTFNGNINVSATELRGFSLPDLNIIVEIGKEISRQPNITISEIDKLTLQKFGLSTDAIIDTGQNK